VALFQDAELKTICSIFVVCALKMDVIVSPIFQVLEVVIVSHRHINTLADVPLPVFGIYNTVDATLLCDGIFS
jgi:hypothetical protein